MKLDLIMHSISNVERSPFFHYAATGHPMGQHHPLPVFRSRIAWVPVPFGLPASACNAQISVMGAFRKENSKWEDADISSVGPPYLLDSSLCIRGCSLEVPWRAEFRSQIETDLGI